MSITAGCACEKVDRVANQQVPTGTMNGMRRQFVLPVGRRWSRTSSLLMLKGDEVSASRRARPSLRARRLTCCRRSTVTGIR